MFRTNQCVLVKLTLIFIPFLHYLEKHNNGGVHNSGCFNVSKKELCKMPNYNS